MTSENKEFAAHRLRRALAEIPPRSAQLIELRLVAGLSTQECAEFYGTTRDALDIALLRATGELDLQLAHGRSEGPWEISHGEELAAARTLSEFISADRSPSTEPGPAIEWKQIFDLVRLVRSHAPEIRAQNAAAEIEEQTSPQGRRRAILRRALLLALLGAAMFLYLRPRPVLQSENPYVPRSKR